MKWLVILLGLTTTGLAACWPVPADEPNPRAPVTRTSEPTASDGAVNPADVWCLGPAELATEPVGVPALERRYRHWMLCDYDRQRLMHSLDRLVALNDPDAVHAKSVLLAKDDPAESARLLRRAKELGWRQRTRQDAMSNLPTRP